jgi:hypothetical protein
MKAAALTGALAVSGRLLEGEAGAATPPIDKDLDGVITYMPIPMSGPAASTS